MLVLWPCSLAVPIAYQVAAFSMLVSPDCRLPRGWKISTSRLAILPLPLSANLKNVIHRRHNELLEEDRNDPTFASDSDIWPALLAVERLVALKAFEGPVRLSLYNRAGRHAWWNSRSFWEVTAALCAVLQVPAPVGVLDTGVSQSTCSWAPSTAQLRPRGGATTEASGEGPHEEAPHEESDDQNC
jgi:hypothetical protein